ncbi:MAG: phenylalanine--tRNA ligase beta subunit-related protein [Candidatus Pacebacteria bacterium]|nr:phenylalanine--tRNA ligase beta subunit-related protein [Candidatus Paceibacterota bacterium]
MELKIQKEIFETFPDFIAGVVLVKGCDNQGASIQIAELLRKAEKDQVEKFARLESFSQHPQISAWRSAYRRFGSDPHQYRCSAEAIIRRVLKGDQLPDINKLVDLYNYISLKYVLPVGGEDTEKIKGDLFLGFADGTEQFIRLGGTENEPPQKGEVVYKDDIGVACRRWNWREADRTKLTEQTRNAIIVVEALSPVDKETVTAASKELAELIQKYCACETSFYLLDKTF